MKKYFKFPIVLFLSCLLWACSPEEDNINYENSFSFNDTATSNELDLIDTPKSTYSEHQSLETVIRNVVSQIDIENLDEKTSMETLDPLIDATLIALNNDGITNEEIIESFGSLQNPAIALVGIGIAASNAMDNIESGDPDPINCLGRAYLGMDLQKGFWSQFRNRRVMLKAIGKAASRTLGWVGTALLVYDFADCMGWLD
ncbi:hypothetical protein [Nonlabens sp.]|uniref:hypothetical protein n=1 Tax=Nonlabens sp. TaxID=1888209 RepID=UPI003F69D401